MTTNVLFIGDPHFQVTNVVEIDQFMEKIINLATEKQPDIIIIAGDLLHTHERLHTTALNKAYDLVSNMKLIAPTYVLVGNHDYVNNSQFLTDNHWMNAMKEWKNTVIVDQVLELNINKHKFIFVPYVPPGRFHEALNMGIKKWEDASCIWAHQEFYGCKMGAIVSVEGDKWDTNSPLVISGHIHSKQSPQPNIYYSGSAMQHAFGESEKNIIAYISFYPNSKYNIEEIDLSLPRKKIVYMDVEDIATYQVKNTEDQVKLTVSGNYEEFKALKKSKEYKNIVEKGLKVVFKPKKSDKQNNAQSKYNEISSSNFGKILNTIVTEEKDPYLTQSYELIVNGKEISTDDVLFL